MSEVITAPRDHGTDGLVANLAFTRLNERFTSPGVQAIAAEDVFRVCGLLHSEVIGYGWLTFGDDSGHVLLPAGRLKAALDSKPDMRPEMQAMIQSLKVLREEIHAHWQALANRMASEDWTPEQREEFAELTGALYRESNELNCALFNARWNMRWV